MSHFYFSSLCCCCCCGDGFFVCDYVRQSNLIQTYLSGTFKTTELTKVLYIDT